MGEMQTAAQRAQLRFTLTREPVNEQEQALFADDLARLGLDDAAWMVLNGSVETGTRYSLPKVLRGYAGNNLVGVAYVVECRKIGNAIFANPRMAKFMDSAGMPTFHWWRNNLLTDSISNPGFVAGGLDRAEFYRQAVAYLRSKHISGTVINDAGEAAARPHICQTFADSGVVDVERVGGIEALMEMHKNLRRKISKFANKGGTIEVLRGPMSEELRRAAQRCQESLRLPAHVPFQDNYIAMSMRSASPPVGASADRLVHFVARFDGEFTGYHSFVLSGKHLCCLSGAFDRTRHTNYHAYENLIVESIRFGLENGIRRIQYGPITNETKAKMMTGFSRAEMHHFVRFGVMRGVMERVLQRSRLGTGVFRDFANLEARTAG